MFPGRKFEKHILHITKDISVTASLIHENILLFEY